MVWGRVILALDPMRNARHMIAVTLVATAICADRVAVAAPAQAPSGQFAGRLIQRLTTRFRRVVAAATLYQPRREDTGCSEPAPSIICERPAAAAISLSPFQFRLPPPLA
jgi:hypothetical protein